MSRELDDDNTLGHDGRRGAVYDGLPLAHPSNRRSAAARFDVVTLL